MDNYFTIPYIYNTYLCTFTQNQNNMKKSEVLTIQQYVTFYKEEIQNKTERAQKIYITKQLQIAKEWLQDVASAWDKEIGKRWLHGEQINYFDLLDAKNNLAALQEIKACQVLN